MCHVQTMKLKLNKLMKLNFRFIFKQLNRSAK